MDQIIFFSKTTEPLTPYFIINYISRVSFPWLEEKIFPNEIVNIYILISLAIYLHS